MQKKIKNTNAKYANAQLMQNMQMQNTMKNMQTAKYKCIMQINAKCKCKSCKCTMENNAKYATAQCKIQNL